MVINLCVLTKHLVVRSFRLFFFTAQPNLHNYVIGNNEADTAGDNIHLSNHSLTLTDFKHCPPPPPLFFFSPAPFCSRLFKLSLALFQSS